MTQCRQTNKNIYGSNNFNKSAPFRMVISTILTTVKTNLFSSLYLYSSVWYLIIFIYVNPCGFLPGQCAFFVMTYPDKSNWINKVCSTWNVTIIIELDLEIESWIFNEFRYFRMSMAYFWSWRIILNLTSEHFNMKIYHWIQLKILMNH